MRRIFIGVLALVATAFAHAQNPPGQYTWEEFSKRIQTSQAITPLGDNLAGDQVSLSNGALSFSVTDVSLPGNHGLAVAFARTYSAFNRKDYGDLGMLADWVVDVPSVSAVMAPDWILGYSQTQSRCSSNELPVAPTSFRVSDFWHGIQLNIPGVSNGELLRSYQSTQKPADGSVYYWVTNEQVHVSCLTEIKNGSGEGFLAVTPDGTRYWFDWMGQTPEAPSISVNYQPGGSRITNTLARKKNYLYATRVQDRFGNFVTYSYSNPWNAPGKLTGISSSDGRSLTISYSGANISSVSDGQRTWSYSYASTSSGRKTLTGVSLPDGSVWAVNFAQFTNAEIKHNEWPPTGEIIRTCTMNETPLNYDASFTGSVTHPSGGTATFVLNLTEHGRSFVPVSCYRVVLTAPSYSPLTNDQNDDQNLYATSAYSLTLKQKTISGPGLETSTWAYAYSPNFGLYFYPGTTRQYPVCDTASYDCSLPPCTSEDCARSSVTKVTAPDGSWVRYFHGNTYRYNEGKLLKIEWADAAGTVLKRTVNTYDLTRQNQQYPFAFGASKQLSGEGFAGMYHRPLTSTWTDQQGTRFSYQIDAFDALARPLKVTRASFPVPVDPLPEDPPPPVDPPPPPPTWLAVPTLTVPSSATTNRAFTVSWTSVANALTYVVERKVLDGSFTVFYNGSGLSATSMSSLASRHYFRVKACHESVCSEFSPEKSTLISSSGGGGIEP